MRGCRRRRKESLAPNPNGFRKFPASVCPLSLSLKMSQNAAENSNPNGRDF